MINEGFQNVKSRIFTRLADLLAVCLFALVLTPVAYADTIYVDTSGNATHTAPHRSTVDYDANGRARINPGAFGPGFNANTPGAGASGGPSPTPRSLNFWGVPKGSIGPSRDINGNFTDNYGNKTSGKITVQDKISKSNSALSMAGGALMTAQLGGAITGNSNTQQAAVDLGSGNYGSAAQNATLGTLQGIANYGDMMSAGLGSNIYGLIDGLQNGLAQAQQQKSDAAVAKQAADAAAQLPFPDKADALKNYYGVRVYVNVPAPGGGYSQQEHGYYLSKKSAGWPFASVDADGRVVKVGSLTLAAPVVKREAFGFGYETAIFQGEDLNSAKYEKAVKTAADNAPKLTIEDLLLSQLEMQQIIANKLQNALDANNANHTELLNLLYGMGAIRDSDYATTAEAKQFETAPYTNPATGKAEQTIFKMNPDGSVTASTIQRPDLAPNSSQAPERAPIPTPSQTSPSNPTQQAPSPEIPDVCKVNPNSIMCADAGNGDYEDPKLPESKQDFNFNPMNIFPDSGSCPAPKSFALMGSQQQLSYQPICDLALSIRPIIIVAGMLLSMFLVYSNLGK